LLPGDAETDVSEEGFLIIAVEVGDVAAAAVTGDVAGDLGGEAET
jgi:hypothetical protein